MKKLTSRQRAFALEYGVDLNATQAAIRAGYSAKAAKTLGFKLLRHQMVRNLVDGLRGNHEPAPGLTRQFVVAGLMAIADDPKTTEKGRLQALRQLAGFLGPLTPARPPQDGQEARRAPEQPPLAPSAADDDEDDMRTLLVGAVRH